VWRRADEASDGFFGSREFGGFLQMASLSPLLLPLPPVANVVKDFSSFWVQPPPSMAFNQSLIYFDLPVCPVTQVSLVLLYLLKACNNSIKVTKRACMTRGRTPAEVWMRTPDEVQFYTPIYQASHIHFL
jgi:hypothetical protein